MFINILITDYNDDVYSSLLGISESSTPTNSITRLPQELSYNITQSMLTCPTSTCLHHIITEYIIAMTVAAAMSTLTVAIIAILALSLGIFFGVRKIYKKEQGI